MRQSQAQAVLFLSYLIRLERTKRDSAIKARLYELLTRSLRTLYASFMTSLCASCYSPISGECGLIKEVSNMLNEIIAIAIVIAFTVLLFLLRHMVLTVGKRRKRRSRVARSRTAKGNSWQGDSRN